MSRTPELILANANVITLDPQNPKGQFVAVRGERVLAVGQKGDLSTWKSRGTRIVDCQGMTLIPGFNDAHLHFLALASSLDAVDCSRHTVRSIGDIKEAIAARAAELPPDRWVRARGYDEASLAERRSPTRQDLDEAAPHHRVRLDHRSGHACVLNSMALAHVGIAKETPDPPDGVILRDESGEPTGVLLEMAQYISRRIEPEHQDGGQRLAQTSRLLLSLGITSFQDASPANSVERFDTLRQGKSEGYIAPRVTVMPGIRHLGGFLQRGLHFGSGDEHIRVGAAKLFLTTTTGALQPTKEELRQQMREASQQGYPVAIHAVEEEAIEAATEVLHHVNGEVPHLRHRIEHCSECPPRLVQPLKASGAVVVTQPGFLYHNGQRYLQEVPLEMQPSLYRIGTWLKEGVPLAFSSDAPVAPPNPLEGVYAAVTRKADTGEGIAPQEAIPAEEALRLYTLGGAYAAMEEDVKGTLQPDKLADMVLLDGDPTAVDPEEIRGLRVRMSVVGGEVVWEE